MRAHTRRRSVAVSAGAVAALLLVSGCSNSSGGSTTDPAASGSGSSLPAVADLKDPTSPVVLDYVGAAYAADDLKPVFAAFTAAHPNITIKYESQPFDQLNNVLQTRLSDASGGIDVFDSDMPRTSAYAARGWLSDITPVFGDLSSQIDKASIDSSSVDGKLLAMPLQTSSQLLYFNKALLTKAGVTPPTADSANTWTWQQVAAAGKKAQAAGAKWGLVYDQVDRYYQLQPFPESVDGGPGAKGPGNLTPDVNNAKWISSIDWFGKTFADKLSPRGVPAAQTAQEFQNGNTAFFAGGPWWAPGFLGQKGLSFGVAPYPYMEGGKPATPSGAWSLGLNPSSKNKEASLIFMNFMGLANGGFTQYVKNIAIPPANTAATAKYYAQPTFTAPNMAGAAAVLKDQIANTSIVRLKTVGYIEFEDTLTKAFNDVINGTSATDALNKANSDLDAAWQKYR